MEGFAGEFILEGDWHKVRRDFAIFRDLSAGTFFFNIQLQGRFAKRAVWILDYVDPRNYIEYEINETTLKRTIVSDGKRTTEPAKNHGLSKPSNDSYTIAIQRESQRQLISATTAGEKYKVLSDVIRPQNLSQGKLGFPKDQMLNQFRFEGTPGK